ncbi:hypothetical protein QQF64_012514 [Cirrhinus molitorella]|uniref:Uncharacterized protein n=2 Tax=Cirrhinus molitorella TaxID=172907 RepID=A0AA88PPR3_9TELE|nr:hypothetical protein Q8A67_011831 [Cirrhinus molitorella]
MGNTKKGGVGEEAGVRHLLSLSMRELRRTPEFPLLMPALKRMKDCTKVPPLLSLCSVSGSASLLLPSSTPRPSQSSSGEDAHQRLVDILLLQKSEKTSV